TGRDPAAVERRQERGAFRLGALFTSPCKGEVGPRSGPGGGLVDSTGPPPRPSPLQGEGARFVVGRWWCAAIDVQPVPDGEILEIAKPGIDAAERFVGPGRA